MKHGVLNRFIACGWFVCLSADSETQANPVILSSTSYTYDRLGRQLSAIAAGVSTNLFEYDGLDLVSETQNGVVIDRATDSLGRAAGFSVAGVGDPGSPYAVQYGYDAYGRFSQVSNFQFQVSYSFLPGSSLVSGMTASTGHAWTRSYESQRNLISAVENTYGSTVISRFDYANDEIGRRTAISRSGTAFDTPVRDAYGYNARSEVTSARRTLADTPSQEVRGFSYDYAYDPIGNRTSSTEYDHEDNTRESSYAANALNQYTQRTVPGYAGVRGSATNSATVTVNGNAAWRLDDYFYGGDDADNSLAAVMKELDITAVVNPPGTNTPDIVQSVTGRVFVAKSPETFTHDDDGNLTQDGRFIYTWDGENRLVSVETRGDLSASVPRVKVTYAYDHQSRRIGKVVSNLDVETWTVAESRSFLYDGWNMIREFQSSNIPLFQFSTNAYVWGLDLSGSFQGAGGVGGLLAVVQNGASYSPAYDGNGNVTEYISADSTIAAHYEYSPFGETVIKSGPLADTFAFRFSTKYWEDENQGGLYYYGYRFYSPVLGRWLTRDPLGAQGGNNLHRMCGNNSIVYVDLLGMVETPSKISVKKCEAVLYVGHTSSKKPIQWEFEDKTCGIGGAVGCWPNRNNPTNSVQRWPRLPEHDEAMYFIKSAVDNPEAPYYSTRYMSASFNQATGPEANEEILGRLCGEPACCEEVTFTYQMGQDFLFDKIFNRPYIKDMLSEPGNWKKGWKPGMTYTEVVKCGSR